MKNLKFILPTMALIFAIAASFASNNVALVDEAKGNNAGESGACQQINLDGGKEIENSTGNCFTPDEGNGVCTVTFPLQSATTAYHPNSNCGVTTLYIQD